MESMGRAALAAFAGSLLVLLTGCEPASSDEAVSVDRAAHRHDADGAHPNEGFDHDHDDHPLGSDHDHDHEHPHADHDHDAHHEQVEGGQASAVANPHHPITDKGFGECTCADARMVNGWCRRCGLGWVAGTSIRSAKLYEAVDAHGHDFRRASIECPNCLAAIDTGAFCDACLMGFHDNLLYVSKLTHAMAKGEIVDIGSLECGTCRAHPDGAGWCDACGKGRAGNVMFADRAEYDVARAEYRRLHEALETLDRCEICAICMFTGGTCRAHADGKS